MIKVQQIVLCIKMIKYIHLLLKHLVFVSRLRELTNYDIYGWECGLFIKKPIKYTIH
jgi:hypothetical protein